MKNLSFLLMLICAASCSNDDTKTNDFAGNYMLKAIVSETAVDLNFDGTASTNVLEELQSPHHVSDGVFDDFFNADSPNYFADITKNGILSLHYPVQDIQYLNENPEMPVFMGYDPNFLAYTYEITSENNVVVEDANPEFNDQYGDIHAIIRRTPDTFEVTMTVNIYDLTAKQWVPVELRAVYSKI